MVDQGFSRYPDGIDTQHNNQDFSLRCISPGQANVAGSSGCDVPTPTPTPTGEICLGLNSQNGLSTRCSPEPTAVFTPVGDCSDSTIQLISEGQFQLFSADSTRELQDMVVAVSSSGLSILTVPNINAKPYQSNGVSRYVFPWGTILQVYSRIEFPQVVNSNNDKQVWYKVGYPGYQAIGWIPIRYEGNNFAVNGDSCTANPTISIPTALVFSYDRRAAANYAIEYSWDNTTTTGNLNTGHVTRQLTGIPYADFFYSYLTGVAGNTGSAVFVSEAIWAGGLPMTVGDPSSCVPPPNSSISEGWRYCADRLGASNPWDFHQELLSYYTHSVVPGFNYPNSTLASTNVGNALSFAGCGPIQSDRISSGIDPNDADGRDLDLYIPDDRVGHVSNSAELSSYLNSVLGCNGQTLVQGDYIYINPQDPNKPDPEAVEDGHGLVVVGWGPIIDCSTVFNTPYNHRTIDDFSLERTETSPVPYVADFSNIQPSFARPFYCTMAYDSDGPTGSYFYRHDWFFFHLPDTITLAPSDIYVNSDWNW